jgi:O-methyltransferase
VSEASPSRSSGAGADAPGSPEESPGGSAPNALARRYLDLLKGCLTRELFADRSREPVVSRSRAFPWLRRVVVEERDFDPTRRREGRDWPTDAETMIGRVRLDHLERCTLEVVRRGVPGDLLEAGVWRGGAVILMRAVLEACGDRERVVWAADSFAGLPRPDPARYPADAGDRHHRFGELAVPLEQVRANFARYGLLDERVRFLPGWFRDTLGRAEIGRLALVRVDADMYESTIDVLRHLYPKLSVGGYVIVDDYGAVPGCRAATEDFRREAGVTEPLEHVDWTAVCWRRAT